ncbi:MAG: exodeoxyribonuclease VII small subunit [Anaerolineales bacterium]|nr:exodeoxyribonuclease VII small subunit [Anaerolineales bacterium]MCB9129121.1 exodeoxyribonuclease VII small subunit [Ardenticatenales bacterium]
MSESEITFEAAYGELEAVVAALESGDISLEEALTLYERGHRLAQQCGEMLDNAELRISQLQDEEDGSISRLPFDF